MKKETITVRYEKSPEGIWLCFLGDGTFTEDIPVPKMFEFMDAIRNAKNILNKK